MNNITHLYSNGCSFIKDHKIINNGDPLYIQLIAERHNWTWENQGEPGSCNRRIIRTAARDALRLGANTLMLISLTHWGRTEMFHAEEKFGIDEVHVSVKPLSDHESFYKSWARYADYRGEIANLCADIVMLTNMLQNRNIKYLIYAHHPMEKHDLSMFKNTHFGNELMSDPGVLNIFDDSLCQRLTVGDYFYDWPNGHLSAAGHRHASDVLINLIDEQV
jgi:hypothetical protein